MLPPLRGLLERGRGAAVNLLAVLADVNHLRAFGLMAALVLSTFVLWPYLPIYLDYSVGRAQGQLKLLYLCVGLVTLVTLTLFGRLADRFGKRLVFYILALVTLVLVILVTNLPAGLPLLLVLGVTTALMLTSSGRMVPAMALITGASAPRYRGRFMSVDAAVQPFTSGLTAWVGGLCLVQEPGPKGQCDPLSGFGLLGLLACAATLVGFVLAGRLRLARQTPARWPPACRRSPVARILIVPRTSRAPRRARAWPTRSACPCGADEPGAGVGLCCHTVRAASMSYAGPSL